MHFGCEKVLTVSIPCNSSRLDLEDSKKVSEHFGVKLITIDLSNSFYTLKKEIDISLGEKDLIEESLINMKPRLRMMTLYSIARNIWIFSCSEQVTYVKEWFGYTTKWGDNSSDFNPIANFTVEEVLEIGRILDVPKEILSKAPNDGLGGKTDEEKMGVKYKQISEMIETGNTDESAKIKILEKHKNSKHKRDQIPMYTFERKNFLEEEIII